MNKYAVIEYTLTELVDNSKTLERVLVKYKDTTFVETSICLIGITILYPIEELKLVDICGDFWKWKNDEEQIYDLFYVSDADLFEAEDDDAAKLLFELGEYK